MIVEGRVLRAEENKILTNGEIESREIILGRVDKIENWSERDMTEQEKEEEKLRIAQLEKEKIAELKEELAQTDYQAIKYAEGCIDEAEYAPVKAKRQEIRDTISSLEEATK